MSDDAFARFFGGYPPPVREAATRLREVILVAIPDAREMLDTKDRVVGYGFGDGYADLICTIIPSKTGVKLGVVRGAELADPDGLLEGAGKTHRYVAIGDVSQLRVTAITSLLRAAVIAWRKRARSPAR